MKAKTKKSNPVRSGKRKDKKKKSDLPIVMSTAGAVQVHCRFDKLEDPTALKIHPANPARHPKEQVELLAKIIASHGIRHPIIVSALSGNIVAGHCRRESAILLGIKEYPVVVQAFEDSAQELAVLIADNKIQELAEIDGQTMADVLVELDQVNYPLELTALTEVEIHDYVLGPTGPTPQDDVVPDPPKKPKTIMGDMYLLGDHKLLCGDATKAEDVERVMGGEKADMVFTDPPYGVNVKGGAKNKNLIAGDLTQVAIPFSFDLAVSIATAPNARFYFCGSEGNLAMYDKLFERMLNQLPRHLIWVKNGFVMKPNGYHNQYELIYYGYKPKGGGLNCWFAGRTENEASDVWRISRDTSISNHPTQKPVELVERAAKNSTQVNNIIFDPFLGSGTTIIAAEKLGRKCYGIEIEPVYVDVCVDRWENFVGKKAKRIRAK